MNRRVPIVKHETIRSCSTPRKPTYNDTSKKEIQELINLKSATCNICLDILHLPVVLVCENMCLQNACKNCAEKLAMCFVCNREIKSVIPIGLSICNAIDNLPRNCDACKQIILPNTTNDAHSCLKKHQLICPDVTIDCRHRAFGCLARFKRSDQIRHEHFDCKHVPCENNKGFLFDRNIGCTFVGSCEEHASHNCTKEPKLISDIGLLKLRLEALIPCKNEISDANLYVTDQMKNDITKLF